MSKQSVFVVTNGEYSDKGIVGIFSTQELAEAQVAWRGRYDNSVAWAEWVLDVVSIPPGPCWWGEMDAEGEVTALREIDPYERTVDEPLHHMDDGTWWWGRFFADNEEQAHKKLTDAVAKRKAEEAGL